MIKDAVSTKAVNTALAVSSGGIASSQHFGVSEQEVILYVFGFIVSVIAFAHNEYHINRSESMMQMLSKALRYIVVGVFAYPAAYAYAGHTVWDYCAFKGLAGVIATLSIVVLMDAWVSGKANSLRGKK
ncbi:hypothetical protein [Sulfurovum mangrovi]|uniref:hypothetical protein n=1 Tax=Sulfurovum mangrovi TaxID=2893889 RepID=UPI001E34FD68|nr:hypothetical protein [Sulfurovum mangrovi]UFH59849.1 hypothetical protein LN246_03150 [Sulfurovum mangrovi]UFH59900.1 hypothetical protein LN246_03410 [Sulfurovum mangrovi]